MEWISHELKSSERRKKIYRSFKKNFVKRLYFVCVLNLAKIGQRRLYLKMRIH